MLSGGNRRRTRLHDQSGKRLPIRYWGQLPETLLRRLRNYQDIPWMTPGAVSYLERELHPARRLLELGSGESTAWYASRVCHVTSFEADAEWARKTRTRLGAAGLSNVDVQLGEMADLVSRLDCTCLFDVAIVDFTDEESFTRVDGVRRLVDALPMLRTIVLDDSDRESYNDVHSLLCREWIAKGFPGMKSFPLAVTETTVFERLSG